MEVRFEKGIPGFEEYKDFKIDSINDKFKSISSIENSNIGFISVSPFDIRDNYELDLSDELINELKIEDSNDVLVLSLVTLGSTLEKSTANLKAPLIINIKNNKGKQLILQDDKYKIKEPLM